MALTKAEMAEALFDQLGLNKREARELVDLFFEEVRTALSQGTQSDNQTITFASSTTLTPSNGDLTSLGSNNITINGAGNTLTVAFRMRF